MIKDFEGIEMDTEMVHFTDQPTLNWNIKNHREAIGEDEIGDIVFGETKTYKIDNIRNLQKFFDSNKGKHITFYMNGDSIYRILVGIQVIRVYIENED